VIRRAGLLLGILLLAGCATTSKPEFSLVRSAPDAPRLFWPPPGERDVPRYVYLGELTGEPNILRAEGDRETLFGTITRLFDFIAGEAPPKRMDRPQAGVVDPAGRILVTDIGRGAVFVFDEKLARLDVWDQADGPRGFVAPVGIALGSDGQTLVADADLAIVARLDRNGNPLPPIGRGILGRPNGVAFDPASRRIFVVDTAAHAIRVFDADGNLFATWGERGDQPGQFNFPTHVALLGGELYVSDTLNARVQVLSAASGKPLRSIGRRGLYVGDMVRPKGVAADSEGNVYAVESYFDHLLVYNRRGEFLMPIGGMGNAPGRFHLPAGVWVDARNRVFVADTLNARVSVFQFLGGGVENE
jgi:DNA-binding beta-propeller fold protein YncE